MQNRKPVRSYSIPWELSSVPVRTYRGWVGGRKPVRSYGIPQELSSVPCDDLEGLGGREEASEKLRYTTGAQLRAL